MKKTSMLLLATSLLTLAGCGATPTPGASSSPSGDVSSSDQGGASSSDNQEASSSHDIALDFVFPDTYKTHFNATLTVVSGEASTTAKVDFGADHWSFVSEAKYQYYEKTTNGGVTLLTLDENNEVNHEPQLGSFAETFPNPFTLEGLSSGSLLSEGGLTEMGQAFFKALGIVVPEGATLSKAEIASKDGVRLSVAYAEGEVSTQIQVAFASDYEETRLSPLAESEESEAIDAVLEKLGKRNYTATLTKDSKTQATVLANSDRILVTQNGSTKGYLKTESGYKTLKVDGSKVTEEGVSTKTFSSLVPDFEFSGAIFSNGVLTPLVNSSLVLPHLSFEAFSSTFKNKTLTSLTVENDSLKVEFGREGASYSLVWNEIGSTTLPVDLENVTSEKTWTSEAPVIAGYLETILGDAETLPYWDGGATWLTSGEDFTFSATAKTLVTGFSASSVDEAEAQFKNYSKILRDKGFTEMSASDMSDLEDGGFYPFGDYDENDFEHEAFFKVGDSIVEVFYGYNDFYSGWEETAQCWLSISDDVR